MDIRHAKACRTGWPSFFLLKQLIRQVNLGCREPFRDSVLVLVSMRPQCRYSAFVNKWLLTTKTTKCAANRRERCGYINFFVILTSLSLFFLLKQFIRQVLIYQIFRKRDGNCPCARQTARHIFHSLNLRQIICFFLIAF